MVAPIVSEPVLPPHAEFVVLVASAVGPGVFAMVDMVVNWQPFASLTITVCEPAAKPV